ncbi:docking protein 3 isoform X2 [Boleophthalmus pectinirostris]|uniref:docking protein 3 isoform X2 n=1 Tax=Boleophthalmus pectinirostris TaxID=150288 RepID=UPI000A1C5042|nr:docking protein 3 isoform X2 [Boleophthalmus pectinirostris]
MDVVFKEGLLYLQAVKFGKKSWRKIWMALYKPSSTGVGRLELYTVVDNNTAAMYDNKKARKVVRLSDCLSVTSAPKESCPTDCEAFYLNTTSEIYTLASPTTHDWISALCLLAFQKDPEDADKGAFDRGNGLIMEDNDLYASWESADTTQPLNVHLVTVRSTEASQRCKLTGDYLISPEDDALLLLDYNTCDIIYRWPYKMLRKYGQVEGGFSIEAGRRCESGAGKFVFLSKQAQHIFQIISQQCTEKTSTSQQHNNQAPFDQSTVQSPIAADPSCFQDLFSAHTDDKSPQYYCHLTGCFSQLSVDQAHCSHSGEAVGDGGEDDPGYSLEVEDLNYTAEESIYYNLPLSVLGQMKDQSQDDSESLYSEVRKDKTSLCQPITVQPAYSPLPKPRYHLQQTRSDSMTPLCGTQVEVMDNVKEEEGIVSIGQITPSEASASFKHRLAEIISKDLAKFQAPVPSGAASPTYPL